MKRHTLILFGILFIAALLRIWQLGNVPLSPDWDEAALGYNAYSILTTGKDEYGKTLPLILESFGDFKPALYTYLVIPFLLLFDVSLLAVRMPSALAGILMVFVMYKLGKVLFGKETIAVLAAFLTACTPIAVHFSHVAFESNVGLLFNLLVILFFLYGLTKPRYLLLAAFFAGINFYMYQSERLFTPLLCLVLIGIYFAQLIKVSRSFLLSAFLVGCFTVMPFVFFTLTDASVLSRAQGVSIFSHATPLLERTIQKLADDKASGNVFGMILDNRRIEFGKIIVGNYLSHFDINWLFLTGDKNPRHQAPHMGHLYLWQLPLFLLGLYALCFGPFQRRTKYLLFTWLLIAPIPAAVTTEVPHAVRTLNMFPAVFFFIAIGAFTVFQYVSRFSKPVVRSALVIGSLIIVSNILYFANQYYVQLNYFTAFNWQYGFEQAVSTVQSQEKNYEKIVVAHEGAFNQSYIFFLYFLQYNPQQYQEEVHQTRDGVYKAFGKYEFRRIMWEQDQHMKNTLFVGGPTDFPKNNRYVEKITYPNGEDAIWIVGSK